MKWQSLRDVTLDPAAEYLVLYDIAGSVGHNAVRLYSIMKGSDLQRWKDRGIYVDVLKINDIPHI